MENTIRSFILETIERMTGAPVAAGVGDDTPLGYDGVELESLFLMELVVLIEREFGWRSMTDVSDLPGYTLGRLVDEVTSALRHNEERSRA